MLAWAILAVTLASQPLAHCDQCHRDYLVGRLSRVELSTVIYRVDTRNNFDLTTHDRKAVVDIAYRESTLRPTARNSRSSAYGLYGFLDSTWRGTGVQKTKCPYCQTRAAIKYMRGRYKTPVRALRFHRSRGYY